QNNYICTMSKRLTMTEDEAMRVLGYTNPSGRYKFSDEQEWKEARDKRDEFRLGSKFSKYCSENGINPKDVSLYWDKTKEFSILVRPAVSNDDLTPEYIEDVISGIKFDKKPIVN